MVDFNRLMDEAGIGNDLPIGPKFLRIAGLAVQQAVSLGLLPGERESKFGETLQIASERWLKASGKPVIDVRVMKDMLAEAGALLPKAARQLNEGVGRPNVAPMFQSFGRQAVTLLQEPDLGLGIGQRPQNPKRPELVKPAPNKP